jgi:hypothetical protein
MHSESQPDRAAVYQIRVRGLVGEEWSDWFSGLVVRSDVGHDGSCVTTLTGAVDNSTLHGILDRIRDLNLKLISVTPLGRVEEQGSAQGWECASTRSRLS